jgi:hypothetical protein
VEETPAAEPAAAPSGGHAEGDSAGSAASPEDHAKADDSDAAEAGAARPEVTEPEATTEKAAARAEDTPAKAGIPAQKSAGPEAHASAAEVEDPQTATAETTAPAGDAPAKAEEAEAAPAKTAAPAGRSAGPEAHASAAEVEDPQTATAETTAPAGDAPAKAEEAGPTAEPEAPATATGAEAPDTTAEAPDRAAAGEAPANAEEPAEAGTRADDVPAEADAVAASVAASPAPLPLRILRTLRPRTARRAWRGWQAAHPVPAQVISLAVTGLALALVVIALLMPNKRDQFHLAMFTRIPVEALIGAAVLIVLPRRPRVVVAVLGGAALGVLTVLNVADVEFNQYLGRSFNVILDWSLLGDAKSYLSDTLGGTVALLAAVGAVLLVLGLLAVMALAVVRVGNFLGRNKARSTRGLLLVSALWMTCSTLNLEVAGVPVASEHTVTMLKYHEQALRSTIKDEQEFAKTAKADAFGNTPGSQLVPDLRGKDMIFTFIESYGRSAIEDPIEAPGVDKTLDVSTQALAKAGFHAKSGWLTSATYGGGSWLGHSTTMSGLWIDNQNRYRTVTTGDHLTLTKAFQKTGAWDTVGIMPGVQKGWPESKWYGLDKFYNAFQMGYRGPKFSWSTMPDQYALEAFQRLEHSKKRDKPLMGFVILTSSHQPWAPIPKMVPWDQLGDGSVFKGIEAAGTKPQDIITNPTRSREEYGKSVQYSVTALTQWLERYGNDNTVLVFLGDHQPIARVSGNHASRDVPISIVAKDPKVLDKIASWGWTDGLRPAHNAPVWKMSAFRDRFLTAYGSTPHPSKD